MPVEIRELVIKAVVENEMGKEGKGAAGQQEAPKEAIIQICVERVLEILKVQKER
ncbi:DUF5908 family protein [Chitinophaga defluvii]|uniref:DUF5908 family protein n=1 Tax=Chitinophaga defluvii TaxID=3163343 RepID=A0ABV2T3Z5_9BACT